MTLLALSLLLLISYSACGDPSKHSEECVKANKECEEDTDCVHRLGYLQATCNTNTCQPQCRKAVLNLFQNRKGRALLRTDTSCLTGRTELEKCNFLPNQQPLHCDLAKLVCDASLPCNAKWQVFISECEAEAAKGQCSEKCRSLLVATFATEHGAAFQTCTCTDKEDQLCEQLKNTTLKACSEAPAPTNAVNHAPAMGESGDGRQPETSQKTTSKVDTTTEPSGAGSAAVSVSLLFAMMFAW
uniref:GDNF domain-containing protein n=1 Tax=Steinernema glaseri TaxID=37863 RepID=A0A1I7Z6V0_9BILA